MNFREISESHEIKTRLWTVYDQFVDKDVALLFGPVVLSVFVKMSTG